MKTTANDTETETSGHHWPPPLGWKVVQTQIHRRAHEYHNRQSCTGPGFPVKSQRLHSQDLEIEFLARIASMGLNALASFVYLASGQSSFAIHGCSDLSTFVAQVQWGQRSRLMVLWVSELAVGTPEDAPQWHRGITRTWLATHQSLPKLPQIPFVEEFRDEARANFICFQEQVRVSTTECPFSKRREKVLPEKRVFGQCFLLKI
jgi:hypothetical protein